MAEKTLGKALRDMWYRVRPSCPADWQAVADAVIAAHEARRWKAIAEAHEDYGQCVFINMEDADTPVCASTLDTDFTENCEWYGWTHFAPITLTTETAERLKAAIPAPPKEASDE